MVQASPRQLSELTRMRKQVIRLSDCQSALRSKLKEFLESQGVSYSYISRHTDLRKNTLESFMDGERVFIGRKNITSLTACISASELGEEILSLVEELGERNAKLARYRVDVIDITFDLLYAFRERSDRFTILEFAKVFDGNSKIVSGALVGALEALETLQENPVAIQEILDCLADEEQLDEQLEVIREDVLKKRQPKIDRIKRLTNKLLPFYGTKVVLVRELELGQNNLNQSKLIEASDAQLDRFVAALTAALAEYGDMSDLDDLEKFQALYKQMREALGSQKAVADALGIAASTLSDATHGKVSLERLVTLCEKAQEVIFSLKEEEGDNSADSPEVEAEIVLPEAEAVQDLLDTPEANQASVDQEVFVPPVFQNISDDEDEDIDALLEALKKSLRRSGVLLYAVARLKDPEMRAQMSRPDVQRLIDEIYMALELATTTHPGALTDLYQARREQRESRFASNPKKGAK